MLQGAVVKFRTDLGGQCLCCLWRDSAVLVGCAYRWVAGTSGEGSVCPRSAVPREPSCVRHYIYPPETWAEQNGSVKTKRNMRAFPVHEAYFLTLFCLKLFGYFLFCPSLSYPVFADPDAKECQDLGCCWLRTSAWCWRNSKLLWLLGKSTAR